MVSEVPKNNTIIIRSFHWFCILWILMHVWATWKMPFSIDELKVLHLGLSIAIVFFTRVTDGETSLTNKKWLWFALSILAVIVCAFFFFDYSNMIERTGFPSQSDVILGSILITITLFATFVSWGWIIPSITFVVLLYGLFGEYLSGFLAHGGLDYARFIGYNSTYFMGTLGSLTGLSATVIIHFVVFGALLQACGGYELIEKISYIVGSKFRSGAAQTAIISSCFMGMVSGSTAANVAITGSFTIPLMKKRGFSPNFAGAVEAVASTGGQIMPPIMGVSAFIMAGLTDRPYAEIVIAAFLPAMVYFLNLSFAVFIRTRKLGITLVEKKDDSSGYTIKDVMLDHGHLLIPLIVLTWRVLIGETPAKAILYGNASLAAIGFLHVVAIGEKHRIMERLMKFANQLYFGFFKGAREGAKLAVILGTMGIIVEMTTVTGFGQRLSYAMVDFASGNSLILVALVAILTIFFGMGMPTPGAYLLTVLLSAPALIKFGFPELQTHFYVFYFAIISSVTPPVAIAVLVAIGISKGTYFGSALNSMRLALPGFLMPLYFLYDPVILNLGSEPLKAIFFNVLLLFGMCCLCAGFDGYFLRKIPFVGRIAFAFGGVMILHPNQIYSWLGIIIIAPFIIMQFYQGKRIVIKT